MIQDPISNLFTCIRNSQKYHHSSASVSKTKMLLPIVDILYQFGYIVGYTVTSRTILIYLKTYQNRPGISEIKRISTPGRKVYWNCNQLRKHGNSSYGLYIVSTSKGILSHISAISLNVGGKVLGYVQ